MAIPAPGRFTGTTATFNSLASSSAMARPATSAPSPGDSGMTSVMVPLGYPCAATRGVAPSSVRATTRRASALRIVDTPRRLLRWRAHGPLQDVEEGGEGGGARLVFSQHDAPLMHEAGDET